MTKGMAYLPSKQGGSTSHPWHRRQLTENHARYVIFTTHASSSPLCSRRQPFAARLSCMWEATRLGTPIDVGQFKRTSLETGRWPGEPTTSSRTILSNALDKTMKTMQIDHFIWDAHDSMDRATCAAKSAPRPRKAAHCEGDIMVLYKGSILPLISPTKAIEA